MPSGRFRGCQPDPYAAAESVDVGRYVTHRNAVPRNGPVLRRHLDALKVRPEGQGRRDRKRYLRVPDHGTEYADRHVSPQGHAGDPDDTGRD